MTEKYQWGVRDITGVLGPRPFHMPSERAARREVENDPGCVLVRRPAEGGEWEEVR